jgi:hypothetical protein
MLIEDFDEVDDLNYCLVEVDDTLDDELIEVGLQMVLLEVEDLIIV